jgi:hypothetical protein
MLIGLDLAFSSLAIVTAGVLGNGVTAEHVPVLKNNATWLSRLVLKGLTGPKSLADWLVGKVSALNLLYLLAALLAAELVLMLVMPLFWPDRSINARMMTRVMSRLLALSTLACIVGTLAGTIAWGVALLINANNGGVIQTLAIVAGIVALLIIGDLLAEIVPAAAEVDAEVKRT